MDDSAAITEQGGPYAGLTREAARERILADLERQGDLVAAVEHEMILGRCQRSNDIVEPRIKTQWFIDVKPMAALAMAAVREGRTRIVPKRLEKVFFDWMENIRDWNVSRQLWWGHRIPAWYCPDGHVTVSDRVDGPERCTTCGRLAAELRQDEDIFDTWYSSGLWPFSTLGWPDKPPDFERYYPGSVMETAYDILFFWVARMMMLGEWFTAGQPFATVYLSGLVRDPYGRKMSKTTGNVIDPLGVIDELGADALRFALTQGSVPGADQRLARSRLEGARNFGNKVWNAARFVLGSRPADLDATILELPPASLLGPADHWILARAAATTEAVDRAYDTFQFAEAARLLHEAIWNEYCDVYLELAKVELASGEAARRDATWQVLVWVLDRYLRLLHPIMPHLTEELWSHLPHRLDDGELLIVAPWPSPMDAETKADERVAASVQGVIELIGGVRNARAEAGIDPRTQLDATVFFDDAETARAFGALSAAVERLARVKPTVVDDRATLERTGGALTVLVRGAEARLSRGDADLERERERLRKELGQVTRALEGARVRLSDQRFLERAPKAVVDGARSQAAELEERVERLQARLTD